MYHLHRGQYFKYNVGINSKISLDNFKVNDNNYKLLDEFEPDSEIIKVQVYIITDTINQGFVFFCNPTETVFQLLIK